MAAPRFDVVGIGNALVDVLVHADDAFLDAQGMAKGTMTLIDDERARALYDAMPPGIEMSGGSNGNAMAALASLGGRGAYVGKVGDDQLGDVYRNAMRAAGIAFDSSPARGLTTGRSLIFVTPDAQRTMQTYLGAGSHLTPDDVDSDLIADAHVTYLEGYLWDPPGAKQAFLKAAAASRKAGRKVALTLSDPFCVERFREEFLDLVENHVDILFANESEITALYRSASFEDAVRSARAQCELSALTRSEHGSVVVSREELHAIPAEDTRVVDTTGAGDAYAAGFLFGLTHGRDLATCGRIAGIAAAEVISHFGARPEVSLAELVATRLE